MVSFVIDWPPMDDPRLLDFASSLSFRANTTVPAKPSVARRVQGPERGQVKERAPFFEST